MAFATDNIKESLSRLDQSHLQYTKINPAIYVIEQFTFLKNKLNQFKTKLYKNLEKKKAEIIGCNRRSELNILCIFGSL